MSKDRRRKYVAKADPGFDPVHRKRDSVQSSVAANRQKSLA
jgi:hypothetical protein